MANRIKVGDDQDLREVLRIAMSKPLGTLHLDYKEEPFILLQFNVASGIEDQRYDMYVQQSGYPKGLDMKRYEDESGQGVCQMTFDEMISAIEETVKDQDGPER